MNRFLRLAAAACFLTVAAGCATLPNTEFLSERYVTQKARFESARGPLSAKQSAAIMAELKRKSGNLDILDRQVALEQVYHPALHIPIENLLRLLHAATRLLIPDP